MLRICLWLRLCSKRTRNLIPLVSPSSWRTSEAHKRVPSVSSSRPWVRSTRSTCPVATPTGSPPGPLAHIGLTHTLIATTTTKSPTMNRAMSPNLPVHVPICSKRHHPMPTRARNQVYELRIRDGTFPHSFRRISIWKCSHRRNGYSAIRDDTGSSLQGGLMSPREAVEGHGDLGL